MKKLFLLFLFTGLGTSLQAQIAIYIEGSEIKSNTTVAKKGFIQFFTKDPTIVGATTITTYDQDGSTLVAGACADIPKTIVDIGGDKTISYMTSCSKKEVSILHNDKPYKTYVFDGAIFKEKITALKDEIAVYFLEKGGVDKTPVGTPTKIVFYDKDPTKTIATAIAGEDIDVSDFPSVACTDTDVKKTVTINSKTVAYSINCKKMEVTIYASDAKTVLETYTFDGTTFKVKEEEEAESPTDNFKDILFFPLNGNKTANDCVEFHRKNRVIILDANPSKCHKCDKTGLYKFKKGKEEGKLDGDPKGTGKDSHTKNCNCKLVNAEALPINRYLSVLIENYNFHDLETFSITVNGENYSYDQDLKKIYDLAVTPVQAPNPEATFKGVQKPKNTDPHYNYLLKIKKLLDGYEYLNLNDLYKVQEYKLSLEDYYTKNKGEFIKDETKELLQYIYSWYPKYVSLTPISIEIPDRDEVEITYTMKNRGSNAVTKSLGTFKTFGGVSVDYGAAFYQTDLKSDKVYTTTTGTAPNLITKPQIENSNEKPLGFGLNIDVSYRLGIHLRPTFNFGFFVPLDEDISPYIATGPGVGFYSKNYKINFSWGLALGKVDRLKEQYRGDTVNLEGLNLTNADLTEKVFQSGHYYSLTLSFNIFN